MSRLQNIAIVRSLRAIAFCLIGIAGFLAGAPKTFNLVCFVFALFDLLRAHQHAKANEIWR